jgi:hypothetical protein
MAYTSGTRTRLVIATALVLIVGCALIVWESTRAFGASPEEPRADGALFDAAVVAEALDRVAERTFVPLAPPVVPQNLGNTNPFSVPPER